ncbi:MAG: T9SS type A sorting domain-containing protein [Saprospiraceae bacterium]
MLRRTILFVFFLLAFTTKGFSLEFYVSSFADGNGDGSIEKPWALQQAFNAPQALHLPQDTIWIWLKGGVYTNTFNTQTSFNCFTNGTATSPIIFRNYKNERATIDSQLPNTIIFGLGNCSFTWLWGVEIMNSSSFDRDHSNINRLGNVYCTAEQIKFINLIVHDMGSGLDSWKTAKNSETYGCIIYNIGNNLQNGINWEGHGHGMYLQNDTVGTKRIHDNIVFSTYGFGIRVWQTTTTDAIGNFDIQRNIVFNGGAASENLGGVGNNSRTHNFFVVSNSINNPIRNTVIKHNLTYAGVNTPRPPVNAFGLNYGVDHMVLDSNFMTCQTRLGFNNTPIFNASVRGNTFIAGIPAIYGYFLWGFSNVDFPANQYFSQQPDTGLNYFIYPNKYEKNRAHWVIYNWEGAPSVQIPLGEANLEKGDIYELVNVMDYYNDIILDTILDQNFVSVPMTGHSMAPVIGSSKEPVNQFPFFGVFVLRKIGNTTVSTTKEEPTHLTLNIYPNPGHSEVTVQCLLPQHGFYHLDMVDVTGKTIVLNENRFFKAGEQNFILDIKHLLSGHYTIRMFNSYMLGSISFIKIDY